MNASPAGPKGIPLTNRKYYSHSKTKYSENLQAKISRCKSTYSHEKEAQNNYSSIRIVVFEKLYLHRNYATILDIGHDFNFSHLKMNEKKCIVFHKKLKLLG